MPVSHGLLLLLYIQLKKMWNGNPPHYISILNLAEFPMSQIKKFETLNDISINVYTNEKGILPIWLTDRKRSKYINLSYMENDKAGHFVLIKNLSRLFSSQFSKKEHQKYFCDRYIKILSWNNNNDNNNNNNNNNNNDNKCFFQMSALFQLDRKIEDP